MIHRRRHSAPRLARFLVTSLLGFVLAGCVSLDHPLTGADTSVLDERLIGHWETWHEKEWARFTVGRSGPGSNALEAVALVLNKEGRVQVERVPLYTALLGNRPYLSARGSDDRADGRHTEYSFTNSPVGTPSISTT